jgi:hypothetical protein
VTSTPVPLPSNAVPARGTDKHVTVSQPSTGTIWEFWLMEKNTDGGTPAGVARCRTSRQTPAYAEDPTPTGSNPYPAMFGMGYMDVALRNFPWSMLQVVAPPAAP